MSIGINVQKRKIRYEFLEEELRDTRQIQHPNQEQIQHTI